MASSVFQVGACLKPSLFPLLPLSLSLIGLLASVDVKQNYSHVTFWGGGGAASSRVKGNMNQSWCLVRRVLYRVSS